MKLRSLVAWVVWILIVSTGLPAVAQDPFQWIRRTGVTGPGRRSYTGMAYDEAQGLMLLYGGYLSATGFIPSGKLTPDPWLFDEFLRNDTWRYDGTLWTQLTVTGTLPPTLVQPAMCYHPGLRRVVMFGGVAGEFAVAADRLKLWSFVFDSPTSGHWQVESTSGPANPRSVALAFDASRQMLVLTGAGDSGRETWEWNTGFWTRKPDAPVPQVGSTTRRLAPALGYHVAAGKLLLVDDEALPTSAAAEVSRVFVFDGTQWYQDDTGNLAPPLGAHFQNQGRKLAYDSARERLVAVDSLSSYDFDGLRWRVRGPSSNLPNGPGQVDGLSRRNGAAVAYDQRRGVLVRFGGDDGTELLASFTMHDETWELTPTGTGIQLVNPNIAPPPGPFGVVAYCEGQTLQLHLLAVARPGGETSSSTGLEYRWFKDDALIPAAPGQPWLYVKRFVTTADAGVYHAEAIDDWGLRVRSDEVEIFIYQPAGITLQPRSRRLIPGESFALQVAYNSTLPVTVQWTKDGVIIPGATDLAYSRADVTLADAGDYRASVQNLCSTVQSDRAVISVGPRIITQPTAPTDAPVGNRPVTLTVTGDGAGAVDGTYTVGTDPAEHADRASPASVANPLPLGFIWRFEGEPIQVGPRYTITGTGLASSLHINQPDYEDEGRYDCVITDASGPAYAKTTAATRLLLHPLAPPYLTIQQGRGPDPRTDSGMVFDSRRGRTVLFGGLAFGVNPRGGNADAGHYASNDTFEWDGQVWVKRNPAHRPPAMSGFGIAYDSVRDRTVVFGGDEYQAPDYQIGTQVVANSVWEWDGIDWTRITSATPPPPARLQPSLCFDTVRQEVLLIGGQYFNPTPADPRAAVNALWAWNGNEWTQLVGLPTPVGSASPEVYPGSAFGFDPQRGVATLFGPFFDPENPVWEWSGAAWKRALPPLSLRVIDSRAYAGAAFYDPVRRMVGLPIVSNNLSPAAAGSVSTLVYWNGTNFIRGDTSVIDDVTGASRSGIDAVPASGNGDLTAFDTARRSLVWLDMEQFLNTGPATTREMHFSAKARPVHFPVAVSFAPDQTIQLRVISAGVRPLAFQWFKDGDELTDDAHWEGTAAATLTIKAITAADAGRYSVRVSNALNEAVTADAELSVLAEGVAAVIQGSGLVLSWPGATGLLEESLSPDGPWTPLHGVAPPFAVSLGEDGRYYRVRYP
jgi:hypothetical protein